MGLYKEKSEKFSKGRPWKIFHRIVAAEKYTEAKPRDFFAR